MAEEFGLSISLRRRGFGMGAAALMLLALGSATAYADAAAGRRAYDKGDYHRAAAEWQAAADRGDADAELGLGNLYEFGAGDLQQDYARAAYWYRKAAEAGDTEAEYRLALIYAAGGDNFPDDLVEAEKWASLAAKSQGVWGTLAADFIDQLDKVASPDQRAEGEKRAAAWSEAQVAKKMPPVASVVPGSPAAPAAGAAAPRKGGCPGWPFPTLPCTEEVPPFAAAAAGPATAAAAAAPRPAAKPPLDRLNEALGRVDCAALRATASQAGGAAISGIVGDAAERAKLVRLAEEFFSAAPPAIEVDVVPPPLCRSAAAFAEMRRAGLTGTGDLGLRLDNGRGKATLREGDPIRLEVRAPAYPVDLRIDYFALDGRVLHLAPERGEPPPQLSAGALRLFGDPANGENWRAGGAPFGTEFIAVTATPTPLDLGSRPQVEPAADYLNDLKRALARVHGAAGRPNLAQILPVRTSGAS